MRFRGGLPEPIVEIYKRFNKSGYDLYLIGGAVRNLLLKENMLDYADLKDWDLTTNAKPEEMMKLFSNAFIIISLEL